MIKYTYSPTIFERYSTSYRVNNYMIHCTIWDTSGSVAYDTVRPLAYPDTHVFLLCFTISDPTSLENVVKKWYPEIRQYCQSTPLILCGCKNELRKDASVLTRLAVTQRLPVSPEQGVSVSRQIGASTYVETSAKICPKAVVDAFEVAAMAALGKLNKYGGGSRVGSLNDSASWYFNANLKAKLEARSKSCVIM